MITAKRTPVKGAWGESVTIAVCELTMCPMRPNLTG
jgi:hypothetical protein